jgi:hypothetical protein
MTVAACGLACASQPDLFAESRSGTDEPVVRDGFGVRVPVGGDWIRLSDEPTLAVVRALAETWSHGMSLELTVPPPFPEPVHAYDLLAAARMNASNLGRSPQIDVVEHAERLIRHHDMDCADFRFALEQQVVTGGETGYVVLIGRGLVCAHPDDARRIANLQYAVQSLDGRILAVDEAIGDAFLDSLRALPIDAPAAAEPPSPR